MNYISTSIASPSVHKDVEQLINLSKQPFPSKNLVKFGKTKNHPKRHSTLLKLLHTSATDTHKQSEGTRHWCGRAKQKLWHNYVNEN